MSDFWTEQPGGTTEINSRIDDLTDPVDADDAVDIALATRATSQVAVLIQRLVALEAGGPGGAPDADEVSIDDSGNYYTGTDVEAALQEVGAALEGASAGQFPIQAFLPAKHALVAETNFDNLISESVSSGLAAEFAGRTSDDADGASISFLVALAAGDYKLIIGGWPHANAGILRFALDDGGGFVDIDDPPYGGTSATSDQYASDGGSLSNALVATGITIPTSGIYTLRALVDGKNGSSGGFATNLRYLHLQATSLT